jgi:BMFP domain-containing protein YqiC
MSGSPHPRETPKSATTPFLTKGKKIGSGSHNIVYEIPCSLATASVHHDGREDVGVDGSCALRLAKKASEASERERIERDVEELLVMTKFGELGVAPKVRVAGCLRDRRVYTVQELAGPSLSDWFVQGLDEIRSKPAATSRIMEEWRVLCASLLTLLRRAARQDFFPTDFKPGNVVTIPRDGSPKTGVKLIDFDVKYSKWRQTFRNPSEPRPCELVFAASVVLAYLQICGSFDLDELYDIFDDVHEASAAELREDVRNLSRPHEALDRALELLDLVDREELDVRLLSKMKQTASGDLLAVLEKVGNSDRKRRVKTTLAHVRELLLSARMEEVRRRPQELLSTRMGEHLLHRMRAMGEIWRHLLTEKESQVKQTERHEPQRRARFPDMFLVRNDVLDRALSERIWHYITKRAERASSKDADPSKRRKLEVYRTLTYLHNTRVRELRHMVRSTLISPTGDGDVISCDEDIDAIDDSARHLKSSVHSCLSDGGGKKCWVDCLRDLKSESSRYIGGLSRYLTRDDLETRLEDRTDKGKSGEIFGRQKVRSIVVTSPTASSLAQHRA